MTWKNRQCGVEARERLIVTVQDPQRIAAVAKRIHIIGLDREGPIVACQCPVVLPQLMQHDATIVQRLDVIRPGRERHLVTRKRLLGAAERSLHVAMIRAGFRTLSVDAKRPVRNDPLRSTVRAALRARPASEAHRNSPAWRQVWSGYRALPRPNPRLVAARWRGRQLRETSRWPPFGGPPFARRLAFDLIRKRFARKCQSSR